MNTQREMALTRVCVGITMVTFGAFVLGIAHQLTSGAHVSMRIATEDVVFSLIAALLLCGNVVYQLARLGYLKRDRAHRPASDAELESIYDRTAPSLAILVPSYREELRVLLQTVLSAALVDYPNRNVVVLIDDPPHATGSQRDALEATRRMVQDLGESFAARARELQCEYWRFLARAQTGRVDPGAEAARLATLYEQLAAWIEAFARQFSSSARPAFAHTDRLFVRKILRDPAGAHRTRAEQLRSGCSDAARIEREYARLAALLKVQITSFERKRYVNLSHEPNKAMNLNSYIGLLGRSFREVETHAGTSLEECGSQDATLAVPAADYLLTLDADSFVLRDYALRLIRIMEDDPRVAIAQTPYSAVPGARGLVERIAGATTDIQYIVHQGFTRFDATYWVGANAMLRCTALADIRSTVQERGHTISVFIQDRTVIEDTGSTVDLIRRGWTLYNYPERLAYSATPPDFGSLIIQRRRWSNGGLIILADLARYLGEAAQAGKPRGFVEALMRCYYLASPAATNVGLLAVLLLPWNDALTNLWLPLSAAPYFLLYGRDLRFAGYRWSDLWRVYALNLILLPVNLAGVLRSVQQAATGRKAPFGRTPKVDNRTASPSVHVVFQWAMLAFLSMSMMVDLSAARYMRALFSLANLALYAYAITHFIGWGNGWRDVAEAALARWPVAGRLRALVERGGVAVSAAPRAVPATLSGPQYPTLEAAREWRRREGSAGRRR